VCEAAGRAYGIDPLVFRIVLAVLALTGGLGLLVYGVAWLLLPHEPGPDGDGGESEARRLLSGRTEGPALTAVLVSLVGAGLFLSMLSRPVFQIFSLVLLAATAAAVHWSVRQRTLRGAEPDAPPAAQPPPAPSGLPWWRAPEPHPYVWGPDDGEDAKASTGSGRSGGGGVFGGGHGGGYGGGYGPHGRRGGRRHPRERRRRPRTHQGGGPLGPLTVLLAALAVAAGTRATWNTHPLGESLQIGLIAGLAVLGVGHLIASWAGRLSGGTLLVTVLCGAAAAAATMLPPDVGHRAGHVQWRPTGAAAVHPAYRLAAGRARLDLSRAAPAAHTTLASRVEIGTGGLTVVVPEDTLVRVRARAGVGALLLPGDRDKDVDVSPGAHRTAVLAPVGGAAHGAGSHGTITLDLRVGLGEIRVVR
jgi:phage shock protein PspC (stress-responsive transcriptional regulator)